MQTFAHGTFLADESAAYNTYSGAHSRSNRHGRAIYPDGKLRAVTAGVADTFFSIPAHGRIGGRYVAGWLSIEDDHNAPNYGALVFHIAKRYQTRED
jgi:hypothetical protein